MRLTLLGFSLLPVGCAGGTGEDIGEIAAPYAGPLTSTNTDGGNNGLESNFFHANKEELLAVAGTELDPDFDLGEPPNSAVLNLISDTGGDKAFKYMVACGVAYGTTVTYIDDDNTPRSYDGNGLLHTTQAWMDYPLNEDATNDIFACMLAHLNNEGDPVEIVLSGEAVDQLEPGKGIDPSLFTFEEALWTARVAAGSLIFNVWPLGDLIRQCSVTSTGVDPHLFTRVCGTENGWTCGLTIRHDLATACQGANGVYTCDGARALKTWLKPGQDVATLYPNCTQP